MKEVLKKHDEQFACQSHKAGKIRRIKKQKAKNKAQRLARRKNRK